MINQIAQWITLLFAGWLITVSIFMIVMPRTALQMLGKMASTNLINYTELTLRMVVGLALWRYADLSKSPEILSITGMFLAATSAILFLIPRKGHAAYAVWWSKKISPVMVRVFVPFSLVVGIALIYAVI